MAGVEGCVVYRNSRELTGPGYSDNFPTTASDYDEKSKEFGSMRVCSRVSRMHRVAFVLTIACSMLLGSAGQMSATCLGTMDADRILFLGNSITLHGPYVGWALDGHWGMAASEESKDYVHVLAGKIEAATGGSLALACPNPLPTDVWHYGDALPNRNGNIQNIYDIFEQNYSTWENARIQNQLADKPNIVVLQFGENLVSGTTLQLAAALDTLLTGLKESSNPHIFITSQIIGANAAVDAIKRQACAKDPSHRVFVDLSGVVDLSGDAGHPNDAGMATIADSLYNAMVVHSVPEPNSLTLLLVAGALFGGLAWRRRRSPIG